MADNRQKWEDHIAGLKAEREKREHGLDYKIPEGFGNKAKAADEKNVSPSARRAENNPFVRRLSLDELIDISRMEQNKPPVEKMKLTPFISKEKELGAPTKEK